LFQKEPTMPITDATGIQTPQARCEQLSAATGTSLAGRFHVWRGRSGRRYVVSAYAPDAVPDYVEAVLLAVVRTGEGPRLLACQAREAGGFAGYDFAGADEVHLHLLAPDAAARAAMVADLVAPGACA
jgi:hypothetical protein